jgi:hypothetical protein
MNDTLIVTVYVLIDDAMKALGHRSHRLAGVSDAEVLMLAVVAAQGFGNHHAQTLAVLRAAGYLSAPLSVSRFNRRLHALADWLVLLVETLGAAVIQAQAAICDFIIDSLPVPVCKRAPAWVCRKVRGRAYCGSCPAKREKFFGWRLHLVCTTEGVPVACALLPAGYHDLTPVHELTFGLPAGAWVYADKAYNSAPDEASILRDTHVRLVPLRKTNMRPNTLAERAGLRAYRTAIETLNSQLEGMGLQRLHARTNAGFDLKVYASVLAVACLNLL